MLMEANLRQPPADLNAEMAALGSALISRKAIGRLLEGTKSREFSAPAHRAVWLAMAAMAARGRPVDVLNIEGELRDKGWLERVGGVPYINALAESTVTATHIDDYCGTVIEKALLRDLIEACTGATDASYLQQAPAADLIANLATTLHGLAKRRDKWEIIGADRAFSEQEHEIDNDVSPPLIRLNIAELDRLLYVHPGDLIILGGPTNWGKSATMLNWLVSAAIGQVPSLMVTLEMSRRQCEDRMLAALADVPATPIAMRRLTGEQKDQTRPLSGVLRTLPIQFVEKSGGSVETLCALIRECVDTHGTQLVIVDQLNRLRPATGSGNKVEDIDHCVRTVKDAAMSLGVGIVLLAQINRVGTKEKRATASDLRGSGGIEQDADAVVLVHRPDFKADTPEADETRLEWHGEKQRNGPAGWKIQRKFKRSTQRITADSEEYVDDERGDGRVSKYF